MPAPTAAPATRWRWAEHLGTGLTVGYLALIAVGMLHTFVRFFRFGINILDFADPSDFLLAPFRDPLVIVATVFPIVAVHWWLGAAQRLGERSYAQRRAAGVSVAWWETKPEDLQARRRLLPPLRIATIALWVFASTLWYQRRVADQTMMGNGLRVRLETTSGTTEAGTDRRPLMLIGTTARYVFVFRTEDWRAVIFPAENILRITPERMARGRTTVRARFLRQADSASTPRS